MTRGRIGEGDWRKGAQVISDAMADGYTPPSASMDPAGQVLRFNVAESAASTNPTSVERDTLRADLSRITAVLDETREALDRAAFQRDLKTEQLEHADADRDGYRDSALMYAAQVAHLQAESRTWEYFAGLAFAYFDAPEGTDDVHHAWLELGEAIGHYRKAGGIEPRDPDELAAWDGGVR